MENNMKRKFEITFELGYNDVGTGVIELDQAVIDAVTNEWRHLFYNLQTPNEIAEHIAFAMMVRDYKLSDLDGWANLPNDFAIILEKPVLDDFEITAKEIR
jgi:hypothetical protein